MVTSERALSAASGSVLPAQSDVGNEHFLQEQEWKCDPSRRWSHHPPRDVLLDCNSDDFFQHDQEEDGKGASAQVEKHLHHHQQPRFVRVDSLSNVSGQLSAGQTRLGGVWIGQRTISASPPLSPTHSMQLGERTHEEAAGSRARGQSADARSDSDDVTLSGGTRTKASIQRSRIAGFFCLLAVLMLVLSLALPKWLVRDRTVLRQGSDERLSAAVDIGLFTVCEDTVTGKCYKYINGGLPGRFRNLLWDVDLHECHQFYQATCICAILACLLGAIATFFNFTVPRFDMFRYHAAIFIAIILSVILSSTALICWFVWSGKVLRQHRHLELNAEDFSAFGGGFDLGPSFYFMFTSTILMTVAGKLVLYEMFVSARRDAEAMPCLGGDIITHDADDFTSMSLPPPMNMTIFSNSLADDGDGDRSLAPPSSSPSETSSNIMTTCSPPPEYREVDIITNTTSVCTTTSGQTMDSADFSPLGEQFARMPSVGAASSCSSTLWMACKSEGSTPHHLKTSSEDADAKASGSRGGTLPRNYKQSHTDGGGVPTRKHTRRFLNRRRFTTVLGQRSHSGSDLDRPRPASTHLDEDVTTYTVVPNRTVGASVKRRPSQCSTTHSIYSAGGASAGAASIPIGGGSAWCDDFAGKSIISSPDLNVGGLDFDLSLCMRNAALASAGDFEMPQPIAESLVFDDEESVQSSEPDTPVAECQQHIIGYPLGDHSTTYANTLSSTGDSGCGCLDDGLSLEPSTPVRNDAAAVYHHGNYDYETDL
eukprot:scpid41834/ scgid4124/ 